MRVLKVSARAYVKPLYSSVRSPDVQRYDCSLLNTRAWWSASCCCQVKTPRVQLPDVRRNQTKNVTENKRIEKIVLMVHGYVRMTRWGRAGERAQLHAKHSTFPLTLSHFPSLVRAPQQEHTWLPAPTTHTHLLRVAVHTCWRFLQPLVQLDQFRVSARLNDFFSFFFYI